MIAHPATPFNSCPKITLEIFDPSRKAISFQISGTSLIALVRIHLVILIRALEPSHTTTHIAGPAVVELVGSVGHEAVLHCLRVDLEAEVLIVEDHILWVGALV